MAKDAKREPTAEERSEEESRSARRDYVRPDLEKGPRLGDVTGQSVGSGLHA